MRTNRNSRHEEERVFDWRDDVNTRITMKMNQFANLLKTKRIGRPAIEGPDIESDIEEGEEGVHKFQEELETLLKNFEEDKIGMEEQSEYLSLEKPILQLLPQGRSFRICRRELFCPDENCIQTMKLKTLGQLMNHMQIEHRASKEDTSNMFRYFISRVIPMEIEMKVTTNDEHVV
jgi:hypothetical protein